MKKITVLFSLFILISIVSSSCASNYIAWNSHSNIKKISLEMTKEEVLKIMGDVYILDSSQINSEGKPEQSLVYKIDTTEEYKLRFVDNKLKSWERLHINTVVTKTQIK